MIINTICDECGGKCCLGMVSGNPPCEHLTSTGCSFSREERMVDKRMFGCNVYPFIVMEDNRFPNAFRVLLDTGCPHWKSFVGMREEISDNVPCSLIIYSSSK